jgi:signal transduction histidine kinase
MAALRAGLVRARPEALLGWLGAAGAVLVVYVVIVRGGGLLIGRTRSPHLGLSVLATATVAVVIDPVRTRLERFARRRLLGAHEAPYDVLSQFSRQVARPPTDEPMPDRIARMLVEGIAVDWAQVWLLGEDRLELVAGHPSDAWQHTEPPSLTVSTDRSRSVAVGHGGAPLGVLRVQEHADRPMTAVELRLLAGLASQAGLALHNARLAAELRTRREELRRRAADLRRARDELVNAQYLARRRLERDLHDGAQQELVALGINLRLAQVLAQQSPERAAPVLQEQSRAAEAAIATLTTLSRGVLPPLLTDRGLVPALAAAVRASTVPTRLEAGEIGRFSPAVEGAVYFCCLEALQNAGKHSGARSVEVSLTVEVEGLRLVVSDDGGGIGAEKAAGAGLVNMRDRVEAVGGRLRVDSEPGVGTTVSAVVPGVRLPAQRAR